MTYYAHSLKDRLPEDWEPLEVHLKAVAERAGEFAKVFGAEDWGMLLGWWHDVGKYSAEFQAYLFYENGIEAHLEQYAGRVDHSTAGAKQVVETLGEKYRLLAYCIAGHHAGLADAESAVGNTGLNQRLCKTIPDYSAAPREILATRKLPNPRLSFGHGDPQRVAFQLALFTRMLFSALVDADRLATESFASPEKAALRPRKTATCSDLLAALNKELGLLNAGPRTPVAECRAEVLAACRSAAKQRPGGFSLTVPTGGGKTLSSLAFALEHAEHNRLRQVIYAIPFTSIIEQTANTFRRVFSKLPGETVLEHHTNVDPDRETVSSRLATENWDAPLVVTTNVQLFESLFAAKTSRCRKLHRLCGSVIVLDEAQSIPVELLTPTLAVLRELIDDYGCTVVLCTATQPAILHRDNFPIGLPRTHEIIPEPAQLYRRMKRVEVNNIGRQSDDEIVSRLSDHDQFLCIVNTRPHAAKLFQALRERNRDHSGLFHLSTFMCGQHRSDVLDEIRNRLSDALPCQVVSTQLIEAGVDVDFPVVFRALTGIDSIAQAAGRCNREGLQDSGMVYLFEPTHVQLRGYLQSVADSTMELIEGLGTDEADLLGLDIVHRYFELHYWKHTERWDAYDVMGCFPTPYQKMHFNFRTAAERFRWIPDESKAVFVPYQEAGRRLIERLRKQGPDRDLLRKLQRYSVGLYERVFNAMAGSDIEILDSGYAVLINESCYDDALGFRSALKGYHEPGSLVF